MAYGSGHCFDVPRPPIDPFTVFAVGDQIIPCVEPKFLDAIQGLERVMSVGRDSIRLTTQHNTEGAMFLVERDGETVVLRWTQDGRHASSSVRAQRVCVSTRKSTSNG